jgi:hypothetical protein
MRSRAQGCLLGQLADDALGSLKDFWPLGIVLTSNNTHLEIINLQSNQSQLRSAAHRLAGGNRPQWPLCL